MNLPSVTLICVDCLDTTRAIIAMNACQVHCSFGGIKFLTSLPTTYPHAVKIPPLTNIQQFSDFMLKEIYKYVDTPHMMVVQYDGYILHPEYWENCFLDYDYIGAPWECLHNGTSVGNGGFSIRSKRLMEYVAKNPIPTGRWEEDVIICGCGREILTQQGFTFAPEHIAGRFSFERNCNYDRWKTFGFHGIWALRQIMG